jgi:threonylcarbamoyladenosine tRNA methylthiotransferase MtaB
MQSFSRPKKKVTRPGIPSNKIALATLGCKVNQYESAGMRRMLQSAGFSMVPFADTAGIYIINTCTVTARADDQSRQLIRRANRMNPAARIVVTGCYAQIAAKEIAALPGVTLVAGNAEKENIAAYLRETGSGRQRICVGDIRRCRTLSDWSGYFLPGRTRAFLRIQDGCDAFCSYCIVPLARGASRSLPVKKVLSEVSLLAHSGYREIVLSGIHLGMYGLDLPDGNGLLGLLREIETQGRIPRLRLSSIEPLEVTPGILSHYRESKILCPHFHIPLQSGDDGILRRMGRNYSVGMFKALIETILSTLPDAAIGMDVMVGFPGEGEMEFENTLQFIEGLPAAYLHVFPFSKRPGTPAAVMPGQIGEDVKKRRVDILRSLSTLKRESFARRFIGQQLPVLVESARDRSTGFLKGFSANYIPVLMPEAKASSVNRVVTVLALEARDGKIIGRTVDHG